MSGYICIQNIISIAVTFPSRPLRSPTQPLAPVVRPSGAAFCLYSKKKAQGVVSIALGLESLMRAV